MKAYAIYDGRSEMVLVALGGRDDAWYKHFYSIHPSGDLEAIERHIKIYEHNFYACKEVSIHPKGSVVIDKTIAEYIPDLLDEGLKNTAAYRAVINAIKAGEQDKPKELFAGTMDVLDSLTNTRK